MAINELYFNFWEIFRNELIGDTGLFIIITLVVVITIAIKKNLFSQTVLLMSSLWLCVIFIQTNSLLLWVPIVFINGLLFFNQQLKIIQG